MELILSIKLTLLDKYTIYNKISDNISLGEVMKVLPIHYQMIYRNNFSQYTNITYIDTNKKQTVRYNPTFYLPAFSGSGRHFELNLSEAELRDRTSYEKFVPIHLIGEDSQAYKSLAQGDKETLKHLIKAAYYLDPVYLKIDNPYNIEFEKYLNDESQRGNVKAILTKKLYDGQKGIIGLDTQRTPVILAKNIEGNVGKGFYPQDLSIEDFHKIIKNMLEKNKIKEVENILNQRSIVVRDGKNLKAIDYTEYFEDEFKKAAAELEEAARTSTSPEFAEYLTNQAAALKKNDVNLDCKADKLWAKLQDTPLEFTIGRECYDDGMTPTITRNPELKALLDKHGITAYAKDTIGTRVGIVNKSGTEYLLKMKDLLGFMATKMPFADKYEQPISTGKNVGSAMVDIDVAYVSGHFAEYRGGISIASILPNQDKLAVKTGGGRRMVYHRQLRDAKYIGGDTIQRRLDALLDKSQHKYFNTHGIHDFCILHENVHSLGPKTNLEGLGTYKNKIEEFKADTGAFVMFDELRKKGFYTIKQEKECIISYITGYVAKGPDVKNAHSVSRLIQFNKFINNGAITIARDGKMFIDYKKVIEGTREMLEDAIRIQLSGSADVAKEYIEKNTVWNDVLEHLATSLKSADKKLNSYIVAPLLKTAFRR